jgi:hypothetical protein
LTIPCNIPSSGKLPHTALSYLLSLLSTDRPVCIVAGTNDGYLEGISNYSNFVVKHIYLTTLGVQYWDAFGRDFINYLNKTHGKRVIWPNIQESDWGNSTAIACEDDPVEAPNAPVEAPNAPVEAPNVPVEAPNDNQDNAKSDTYVLRSMFYKCCDIPRLMRIAVTTWFHGKCRSMELIQITLDFESAVREYYADAYQAICNFTTTELAHIFLTCSVHWPVYNYLLEDANLEPIPDQNDFRGNRLQVRDLVDKAIIFPYRIDAAEQKCDYVMPSVIWDSAQMSINPPVFAHWRRVKEKLTELVPMEDEPSKRAL